MGCAPSARPCTYSPPSRLEKMKLHYGYEARRVSTSTRNSGPDSDDLKRDDSKNGVVKEGENNSNGGGDDDRKFQEKVEEVELVDGWPKWLTDNIPREVLKDIVPKSSDSYIKIDKIGQGTYSNVYKARDRETGKIVALKKVRFDTSASESVKFMAREIMILQRLDHPNIVKLLGLATSGMQYSIYLVFEYMQTDLAKILSRPDERLTEPQIKCYLHQLFSGLQHCHERGILHRDIKASNLLIDRNGMLKVADFGLANFLDQEKKQPQTNRVVTLWYRAPELLLGSTDYGVGIDLWSSGCLMAEMFAGRPILPGRTEVEQLHIIFKLCGTPPDDFFKGMKIPSASVKPSQIYKSSLGEKCKNFPSSAVELLNTLLALDPSLRGSACSALDHKFFHTNPLACELSGLPAIQVEEDDELPLKLKTSRGRRRPRSRKEKRKKEQKGVSEELLISTKIGSDALASRSDAHPNAAKNIINKPTLPSAKLVSNNYDLDQIPQRSASYTEVPRLKNTDFLDD